MNNRISKACQECRQRKIRCTGERPCKSCRVHNTECEYRSLNRVRKSTAASTSSATPQASWHPAGGAQAELSIHKAGLPSRDEGIYHSVSATQSSAYLENLQLYYGASSNFAFLQQLHRNLLLDSGSEVGTPGEVQEGGAGLDLFNQRSLFFGTIGTSATSNNSNRASQGALRWEALPRDLLDLFSAMFFDTYHHILSFIHEEDVCLLSRSMYDNGDGDGIGTGQRAVALAVLANGAIATQHLDWADVLYKASKSEASGFDEVVNLHSVQYSLLLAVYQNTMGRPNQSYLHLGSATRKAFAMGLHKDIYSGDDSTRTRASIQQRRTTMWCLYFHESWQSYSLGRICSMKRSDVACPFPESESLLSQSTRLLEIAMPGAEMMYGNRRLSLWETWKAAESIHTELRRFAEDTHLAFASIQPETDRRPIQTFTLTCFYYHTILITFRPFLIVAAARHRQRRLTEGGAASAPGISLSSDEIWLREACRFAVDASRDQLSYILSSLQEIDVCKRLQYSGFFVESSCAVLLYDSLTNTHTFSHNLEYIKAGLQCLDMMLPGEPITTCSTSIRRILTVLERKIYGVDSDLKTEQPRDVQNAATAKAGEGQHQTAGQPLSNPDSSAADVMQNYMNTWGQGVSNVDWGFDVFTTDLNRFFPLDDSYGINNVYGNVENQQFMDPFVAGASYR